jgi:hypothetical protein
MPLAPQTSLPIKQDSLRAVDEGHFHAEEN